MARPVAALVSFRLGGSDGVAVEAAKWAGALGALGFDVRTVAGAGPVDRLVPGLAIDAPEPRRRAEIDDALDGRRPGGGREPVLAAAQPRRRARGRRGPPGRPAVLHHHDLPWQRQRYAGYPPPPDDPAWVHVTVNDLSRARARRASASHATVVRNAFDVDAPGVTATPPARRSGCATERASSLQPTRAIPQKEHPRGLALAEALGAAFWLLGPAEDGFGPELDRLVASIALPMRAGRRGARDPGERRRCLRGVRRRRARIHMGGIRQPRHRVRRLPATPRHRPLPRRRRAGRLRLPLVRPRRPGGRLPFLDEPDPSLLEHNHGVAREHFALHDLPGRIGRVLESAGWASVAALSRAPGAVRLGRSRSSRDKSQVPVRFGHGVPPSSRPRATAKRLPADRRREQLLDVPLELFAQRGYNATTMDDIAEAAGVTKPLLYQHFAVQARPVPGAARLGVPHHARGHRQGGRRRRWPPPAGRGRASPPTSIWSSPTPMPSTCSSAARSPTTPSCRGRVRKVEDSIAESIDVLIDAGLDEDHRRLLAFAVVGMAEGASRHFLAPATRTRATPTNPRPTRLARRLADLAWAGLRSVHPD